jgi:hypothetical protein
MMMSRFLTPHALARGFVRRPPAEAVLSTASTHYRNEQAAEPRPDAGSHLLLLRLCLGLYLMMAAAASSVITVSRILPAQRDTVLHELGLCNGLPCFHSLLPHSTGWNEAVAALNGEILINQHAVFALVELISAQDGRSLAAIGLGLPRAPDVTLGRIIAIYGPPTCVHIDSRHWRTKLVLHYPMLHVVTRFRGNHLRTDAPITLIVVGDPAPRYTYAVSMCTASSGSRPRILRRPWRGFASLVRYLNE